MNDNNHNNEKVRRSHLAVISSYGADSDIHDINEIIDNYEKDLRILNKIEAALKAHVGPLEIKALIIQSNYIEKNILFCYTTNNRKDKSEKYLRIIRREIKEFNNVVFQIKEFSRVLCQLVDGRYAIKEMRCYLNTMVMKLRN
jgi:hypothetical protein